MDSYLGIDIGSSHTKVVEIISGNNGYYLNKFALFPSKGLLESFSSLTSHNLKSSIEYFKSIIVEAGFTATKAYVALPEHRILTKVLELPYIEGDKNIKQAIEFEAAEHLPINLAEMTLKFTVLKQNLSGQADKKANTILNKKIAGKDNDEETSGRMEVLLVAAPTKLIESYVMVFEKIGLEVVAMEPTSIATTRIVSASSELPTVLMEFGHEYVDLVLVAGGTVRFVRSIKLGVLTFVRTLSQEMGLSQTQAENYLFTYGLNPSQMDGKIRAVLEPAMSIFVQEVARFIEYVETRVAFTEDEDLNKIKRLVLAGGGALIPNFIIYLIEKIGLEVMYSDSWKNVDISEVAEAEMLKILGPLFTTAVGIVIK